MRGRRLGTRFYDGMLGRHLHNVRGLHGDLFALLFDRLVMGLHRKARGLPI